MDFRDIIGKKVVKISVSRPDDHFTLLFSDGTDKTYSVAGDCCSASWIEHFTVPDDLFPSGLTILSVEEADGVPFDGHKCSKESCRHDSLAVYNTRFHTDRGDIVLEYRNDSNGYYGGYLTEVR